MSWLFSRALAEDCLRLYYLAGKQSALSNWIGTADAFSHSDRMMDSSISSRYGMTFVPLTAERGAASLMLYLEASLAKPLAPLRQDGTMQTIFGQKCAESWQMSLPGTYLRKTSAEKPLTTPQTTLNRWVTKSSALSYPRKTWVQTTYGVDAGYLHTPTCTANYAAPSMQKWPSCREFVRVFGKPTPTNHEWMMGWPIGWTDLKPLETGKCLSWLQQHTACLEATE